MWPGSLFIRQYVIVVVAVASPYLQFDWYFRESSFVIADSIGFDSVCLYVPHLLQFNCDATQ